METFDPDYTYHVTHTNKRGYVLSDYGTIDGITFKSHWSGNVTTLVWTEKENTWYMQWEELYLPVAVKKFRKTCDFLV